MGGIEPWCRGWRRHGWRHPWLLLAARRLLDRAWYLARYPDVAESGMDPLQHFLDFGLREGREPSPHLSLSGYGWRHGRGRWQVGEALLHYWAWGRRRGLEPLPLVPGRGGGEGSPRLVVCAHDLGPRLFGAERSLLDVVRGLESLGAEVVVAVPNASHPDYLTELLAHCRAVKVLPYAWWHAHRPACPDSVEAFRRLLAECRAEGVYLNTLTLETPALAARALGLPVVTHVRELPAHDPALCRTLGADPASVVARVVAMSDLIVANSRCTARAFDGQGTAVKVVPNTLAMEAWTALTPPGPVDGRPLRIGMLGSLVAKKGLADFAALAAALASRGIEAECRLYGAPTPELETLLAADRSRRLVHRGYVEDPREALAELDVVVNLSRFQESFGRTVLEAMAAARPVVAYAWGALPELVAEGRTGGLVPFGEPEAAAASIAELAGQPDRLAAMGAAGRDRALTHYGQAAYLDALGRAIETLFPVTRTKRLST
ncbi:glycosyltransferase family 4 protein [Halomonas kalidii]|uniref:Glycosyltransferase family 4 protein n=1 Tax=Halomonas kalidii TaxID=3043293 RepID=A0ABT6VGD7_9GAMM|nr:glycosyltransferase family 4 protein [Halomonas kalidii]MDI5933045.1 glycosyltransferase family 4 protein [Halomonas kalidii]